ncbi:autotransporter-associated beta strand repeat-containing protein [Streptomyces sp. CBMAI 2042]|uniref:mannose-binding protein n=1 Tax=Streptomyces sp. CBMAI 2042 TaxID=2305222 RepID=UPI000F101FA3|nr:mannose-binding protein [Streptomyces sp. CBMAI 2042]RLV70179.1 autotransporter-associated beta strand repeat-containing protein [Streptomyces sp. CBMAI 2042]
MPPEPPTPGVGTAAAAAGAEESTPAPPSPTAAPEETHTSPPKAEPEPTAAAPASATEEPAAKAPATPEATAAPEPGAPAETAKEPKEPGEARAEGAALAAAVATAPETRTLTAVDRGRPRTPVLAGAVFIGAALVAIPVLLMGSANDEEPRNTGTTPVAGSADTVLNPETAPAALEDYVAVKPTPSATEQKKITPPKAAPAPAAPAPQPATSAPTEKPKPKASPEPKPKASPKPKPKAAPKPNWGTQTVSATSSIGVGQSWATNRIRMTMQQDGNLVVYNEQNKPIWAAMTFGENHRAIFQPDGNLVIHNGDDRPIWASKTHDFGGAQMVLRADAKVVIVHNGRVVWST